MAQIGGMHTKRLVEPRMVLLLFWVCWAAYFCTYLGRINYNASMAEIIVQEGFSKAKAGLVGTGFFFTYGLGQLVNGFLCDRVSPKWMLLTGMAGSAALNLFMGLSRGVESMLVLWCVNGYLQSMTWSPILRLFATMLPDEAKAKASVNIQTTVAAGTLAAYGLSALFIQFAGWRVNFFFSAGALAAVSLFSFFLIGKVERHAQQYGVEQEIVMKKGNQAVSGQLSLGTLFLVSGLLFFLFSVIANGFLKEGVIAWVPTYISERFSVGSVLSILVTTVLPVTNLVGLYVGDYVNRKCTRDEILTSALFFGVTVCALAALIAFGKYSIALAVFLLAVTTASMLVINTMLISILPLYFWKIGRVSTVSGILNCSSYLGSALATYSIGVMAQAFGWNYTILSWCAVSLLGISACLLGRRLWLRFKQERLS